MIYVYIITYLLLYSFPFCISLILHISKVRSNFTNLFNKKNKKTLISITLINLFLIVTLLFIFLVITNYDGFREDLSHLIKGYINYLKDKREEKRLLKKAKAHLKKLYSDE